MLVVLALLAVVTADRDESAQDIQSDMLLQSLRKQLKENNYDYMSNESKEEINMRAKDDKISTTIKTNVKKLQTDTYKVEHTFFKDIKRKSNPYLERDVKVESNESTMSYETGAKYSGYTISKNDLLYYLDDNHLAYKSGSTTKKYKVLKLRHPSRRSGSSHLIQEEGADGVALVQLGAGPIPQVRLPRARRQYMLDRGELDVDEEELLPDGSVVENPYVRDLH